jgi:hypothetical protein
VDDGFRVGVRVRVEGDECIVLAHGVSDLTGLSEVGRADEGEGLVSRLAFIGVDPSQIQAIASGKGEVADIVRIRIGIACVRGVSEHESISPNAAPEFVLARSAVEHVLAAITKEDIRACIAGERIVPQIAID